MQKNPGSQASGIKSLIYTPIREIISLRTFWYLGKPEDTGFETDSVAYLNLTVGYSLLLTNTNNTFER